MTLVPNETEQALNRLHDVYAAAREEYRKKIAEQAAEIERLRAALARIDKMEAYYYEDSRDVLYSKIGIMRDIARAALAAQPAPGKEGNTND